MKCNPFIWWKSNHNNYYQHSVLYKLTYGNPWRYADLVRSLISLFCKRNWPITEEVNAVLLNWQPDSFFKVVLYVNSLWITWFRPLWTCFYTCSNNYKNIKQNLMKIYPWIHNYCPYVWISFLMHVHLYIYSKVIQWYKLKIRSNYYQMIYNL